jgi:helicase MOV-10
MSPACDAVLQVLRLIQRLLGSAEVGHKVRVQDIGVVAPFYKQVRLLRTVLREAGLRDVRVGSVEDYQGQEERVLIVSCVRSSRRWIAQDRERQLGLMWHDKLFNVCITRARCLLLMVGNPHVLSADPNWRRIIGCCLARGTYHGCRFDPANSVDWTEDDAEYSPPVQDFAVLGMYALDMPWEVAL